MSRSLSTRRAAIAVSVLLGVAMVAPAAARADTPTTAPTITSPAEGATVTTETLTVTATSDAPSVLFDLGGSYSDVVDVVGGSATTQFSVLGFSGTTTVEAYNCDTPVDADPDCNVTDFDAVSVTIDLVGPVITSPQNNQVVGNSVSVSVDAPAPGVRFSLDGSVVGTVVSTPLSQRIDLRTANEGPHTITVQQCNANGTVCGGEDDSVVVVKDTKGPKWSDVSSSLKTVFPAKDHYKDSTVLSARVSERSSGTKVEIRKAGGPLVRTLSLGRVGPGKVRATWNGRKSNGDIASSGKYRFRFVGTDVNGSVGKSGDRSVRVSDKKLVAKVVTRTVSAKGSFVGNGSGTCSGVYSLDYPQSRYGWPKGLGYYSRSKCVGNAQADVAVAVHKVGVPRAVRYGTLSIDTYGGGAVQNAGPGVVVYVTSSGTAGASRGTSVGLAWHNGPAADADNYIKNGRVRWLFGTTSGNWFDVKEFRVTVRVFVLR